jgi:hypothetical protein
MSPSRPDSNSRRHTKRQQDQIRKVAKHRQKTASKRLRIEALEPRTMMDASLRVVQPSFDPFYDRAYQITAIGNGARWDNGEPNWLIRKDFTGTSTNPVDVLSRGISAPDGATFRVDQSGNNNFFPKNGLISVENGQSMPVQQANGDFRTIPIEYAQQQEIDLSQTVSSAFPLNVIEKPDANSVTTYKSTLTVPATGKYTFYMTSLGDGSLTIGTTLLKADRSDPKMVTVDLTVGTVYPVEAVYRRAGNASSEFKIEWEREGLSRKTFFPNNDVTWKHEPGLGFVNNGPVSGIISSGAYFSAEKRLRDDNYALRYKTKVTVPTTGEYTFYVNSDNIARLKLGSDVIIDKLNSNEASGKRTLTAGTQLDLELTYVHNVGPRSLKFEWSGPGLNRQLFATNNLVSYDYIESNFTNIAAVANVAPKLTKSLSSETFFVTWKGQNTVPIKIGASAEDVRKAINALPNLATTGGNVTVSRSENGLKYNVVFGGNAWFRPPMMSIGGKDRAVVNPITKFAITKRDGNSAININNLSDEYSTYISNGNAFPLDNAPLFTPDRISGVRDRFSMSGYLQTPAIGGRFDPINPYELAINRNVERTPTGFRLTRFSIPGFFAGANYTLNAIKDANGNSRPLTLFTMAGLNFEAPSGTIVSLEDNISERGDNLQFISRQDSLLVSAPYEGGKLTLRLLKDTDGTIFKADLRSGNGLPLRPNLNLCRLKSVALFLPSSDQFKMTYDKATEKFSFAISNLVADSARGGFVTETDVNETYRTAVQVFENYKLGPVSYAYRTASKAQATHFDFSIEDFKKTPGKITGVNSTGEPFAVPASLANVKSDYYGITYRTTLTVPESGDYAFLPAIFGGDQGKQELKINGTVVINGYDFEGG